MNPKVQSRLVDALIRWLFGYMAPITSPIKSQVQLINVNTKQKRAHKRSLTYTMGHSEVATEY